jgi:hypothetical protein
VAAGVVGAYCICNKKAEREGFDQLAGNSRNMNDPLIDNAHGAGGGQSVQMSGIPQQRQPEKMVIRSLCLYLLLLTSFCLLVNGADRF